MTSCAWCPARRIDGPLCGDCRWIARQEIAALALDYRDLAALLPAQGGPQQRVSGTRAPSVPLDLVADALMRDIVWRLAVWEPPVREAAGLPPVPEAGIRPARLVDRAATVLSCHVSDFLGLPGIWGYPDGLEGGCVARSGLYGVSSLRAVHARCLAALDRTPAVLRVPGFCGQCGTPALTKKPGTTRVECSHCRASMSDDDYQDSILTISPGASSPDRMKHSAGCRDLPSTA